MEPLVFEPYLRPMVWGGRRLGELLGKPLPPEGNIGESWEVSPHPHHVSRVAEGPLAGRTLNEVSREFPRELYGDPPPADPTFPLLVKLLDCRDLLSIQVHPTDELARTLANERFGKTEAWVVLHADPGSRVYAGFKPGVTRADVEQHLAAGTLESGLHSFTPKPGDCIFLPAGTVHAVGGGVVLAEVQQASDATFRLYDWNRVGPDGRPRQLHVREALVAIDWSAGPVDPVRPKSEPGAPVGVRSERLVRCPSFGLDRLTLEADYRPGIAGRPSLWITLSGAAELRTAGGYARTFRPGETVLVPAAAGDPLWRPTAGTARLLRVHLQPRPTTP